MKKIICMIFLLAMFFHLTAYAEEEDVLYTASIDGVCSLYISPSFDSYELMQFPACSKVELLDTDETWNLVKYKNHVGWINSCHTRATYKGAAMVTGFDEKKTIQVNSDGEMAQMYEVPLVTKVSSGKGIALPDGTVLEMLRKTPSGWGLVTVNDGYMWIDTRYTKIYEGKVDEKRYGPYYVYVFSAEGSGVDMLDSPETKNVLLQIPDCTQIIAREKKDNYIYVSFKGMNGWIEESVAEESLFNAQMKSGSEVMKEAIINPVLYDGDVQVLSAPSYDKDVAAIVLGETEEDDDVFILRTIPGGWNLVLADGVLGWIPPKSTLGNIMPDKKTAVEIYKNSQKGFVSTSDGEGLLLVSYPDEGTETSVIPETAYVEIIAEKNGYKYVRCEYGAGWCESVTITPGHEEALFKYTDDTYSPYIINKDTFLMTLPAPKGSYGSKGIIQVKKNLKLTPLRIVEYSDDDWALVEVGSSRGWINLDDMDSTQFPFDEVLWAAAFTTIILIIIFIPVMKTKKRNAKKEPENDCEKEAEIDKENESVKGV